MRPHFCRPLLPLALFVAAGLLPLLLLRAAESEERRYALIVGVKNYKKDQFRSLPYTENDANDLAVVFKDAGYKRVVLMTQEKGKDDVDLLPTAENIRNELRSFLKGLKKTHTVVVALSGHGVQFKDEDDHFFCPMDADLTERMKLISLKWVYAELKKCDARVKLLLVDACRNDPLAKKRSRALDKVDLESKTRPQKIEVPGGVAAFFSCSAGQESFESDKLKHGVFFHHVLEGLRGKAVNKKGAVDLRQLVAYVGDEVPDAAKEEDAGGRRADQVPELRGKISDMVLVPPPRVAKWDREITNSIGMKLVRILPTREGKGFLMGSPKGEKDRELIDKGSETQHEVEITKEFWLGIHEVTQKQFKAVMGYNPSYFSKDGEGGEGLKYSDFSKPAGGKDKVPTDTSNFPVENVSWEEANEFCSRLSNRAEEKRRGRKYRLPTEAEWEYSCRGGAPSYQVFHFGNSLSSKQANFNGKSPYGGADKDEYLARTCKVGSYEKNRFGLCDMHGNVWEWCADGYRTHYEKNDQKNLKGPEERPVRVIRGGGWDSHGVNCRASNRFRNAPSARWHDLGFRLALVPSGSK